MPGWEGSLGVNAYLWLSPFNVHLKLSQHCSLISYTLIQNKKLKIKECLHSTIWIICILNKEAFWEAQNYLENCFHFPLLFCSLTLGLKLTVLSPTVASVHPLVEKSEGLTRASPMQQVKTWRESCRAQPEHPASKRFQVMWLVPHQLNPLSTSSHPPTRHSS